MFGNTVQGESYKVPQVKLKPYSVDIAYSFEPTEIIKPIIILPSKPLNVSPKQNTSDTKMKIGKKRVKCIFCDSIMRYMCFVCLN